MSYESERIRDISGPVGTLGGEAWGGMSKLTFTTKVLPLFGGALFVAAIGTYLGTFLSLPVLMGVVVAELVLVFTSGMWQQKEGLNRFLFLLYALCSGATLVPLLSWVGMQGGIMLIAQALTVTTVTFGGLALYGLTTKRDLSSMGGILFGLCLALIAGGLMNTFFLHSSMFNLIFTVAGVGVFSGFVVYDMSMIRRVYSDSQYVGAALALFIDFIGLFSYILRLFGIMGSRDD